MTSQNDFALRPAPPGPVQRERVEDRPGARVKMDRIGRAARWFPWWKLLFRAALLRTTRARFRARSSPVTYAAVVGLAWMTSWQAAQTTRGQAQAVEACASTSSVNSSEGFFQL